MKNITDNIILALGAESAGNFSVFHDGKIFHSENFGDLLVEENFDNFKNSVLNYLKKESLIPEIIITDLHPLYVTSLWGEELAKKYKAEHIKVQHHMAHIFSQIEKNGDTFYGITLDGTGYGLDGGIWGGEVFKIRKGSIKRVGHLENQILIGGDLAVREPVRVLIGILGKFLGKEESYECLKKHYNKNQFELLWNQLQEKFNCQETSSTGRVLDAVSILLGFSENERKEKHGATYLLESSSTKPYSDLEPKIKDNTLLTTPLFEYLIKNLSSNVRGHVTKDRLAATAQLYIAQGLHEIIKRHRKNVIPTKAGIQKNKEKMDPRIPACRQAGSPENDIKIVLSGGLSENKIIKEYFTSQRILENKKSHVPVGDAGLSVGQINYYLTQS